MSPILKQCIGAIVLLVCVVNATRAEQDSMSRLERRRIVAQEFMASYFRDSVARCPLATAHKIRGTEARQWTCDTVVARPELTSIFDVFICVDLTVDHPVEFVLAVDDTVCYPITGFRESQFWLLVHDHPEGWTGSDSLLVIAEDYIRMAASPRWAVRRLVGTADVDSSLRARYFAVAPPRIVGTSEDVTFITLFTIDDVYFSDSKVLTQNGLTIAPGEVFYQQVVVAVWPKGHESH